MRIQLLGRVLREGVTEEIPRGGEEVSMWILGLETSRQRG